MHADHIREKNCINIQSKKKGFILFTIWFYIYFVLSIIYNILFIIFVKKGPWHSLQNSGYYFCFLMIGYAFNMIIRLLYSREMPKLWTAYKANDISQWKEEFHGTSFPTIEELKKQYGKKILIYTNKRRIIEIIVFIIMGTIATGLFIAHLILGIQAHSSYDFIYSDYFYDKWSLLNQLYKSGVFQSNPSFEKFLDQGGNYLFQYKVLSHNVSNLVHHFIHLSNEGKKIFIDTMNQVYFQDQYHNELFSIIKEIDFSILPASEGIYGGVLNYVFIMPFIIIQLVLLIPNKFYNFLYGKEIDYEAILEAGVDCTYKKKV